MQQNCSKLKINQHHVESERKLNQHIKRKHMVCTKATSYVSCSMWLFSNKNYMRLDFGKPTKMSHFANYTFLAQLIATFIHYPCTVAIPGLAAWSAFLERIFPTM